jgi:hypothetical protein
MTWLAITDRNGGQFAPGGIGGSGGGQMPDPTALLPRGTLLIETLPAIGRHPQTLLSFGRTHPWSGGFSLQLLPSGGVTLIETQERDVRHATLPFRPDDRSDSLRISYSWDAPARTGRLTLERPGIMWVRSIPVPPPHPMPLSDLRTAFTDPRQRHLDPEVIFAALSDEIEPVGPMPGLAGGVPVRTPEGYVEAARLRRGDCVRGTGGAVVPVLHRLSRCVPAAGSFRPVRLRAPYFGLRADIVVAPHQRLVIGGADVEYLFGSEAVLVAACHLVNGSAAVHARTRRDRGGGRAHREPLSGADSAQARDRGDEPSGRAQPGAPARTSPPALAGADVLRGDHTGHDAGGMRAERRHRRQPRKGSGPAFFRQSRLSPARCLQRLQQASIDPAPEHGTAVSECHTPGEPPVDQPHDVRKAGPRARAGEAARGARERAVACVARHAAEELRGITQRCIVGHIGEQVAHVIEIVAIGERIGRDTVLRHRAGAARAVIRGQVAQDFGLEQAKAVKRFAEKSVGPRHSRGDGGAGRAAHREDHVDPCLCPCEDGHEIEPSGNPASTMITEGR